MKALIVCVSAADGNTRKIAEAMADPLDAEVVDPGEVDDAALAEADLIGIGSGIYAVDFHHRIRTFVRRLPQIADKPAFVYWTSGAPEPPVWRYSDRLADRLEAKGYSVLDSFSSRGWRVWLPFRLVPGLDRSRPNESDLERARQFAEGLRDRVVQQAGTTDTR
jgi:flavodoxin